MAIGDIDSDGDLDILTANITSRDVSVIPGRGVGDFARRDLNAGSGPGSVVLGDLNEDGHLDIIEANSRSTSVSVLLGEGRGAFETLRNVTSGSRPQSMTIGDLNEDGHLDVITANQDGLGLLIGDGLGDFATSLRPLLNTTPISVALGDTNRNGHLDVILGTVRPPFDSGVMVISGTGRPILPPLADVNIGVEPEPASLAVGDVNDDGHADILSANTIAGRVSLILSGPSRNSYRLHNTFAFATGLSSVKLGDINADGHLDMIVANAPRDEVHVLLGNGRGDFAPHSTFDVGEGPESVALGDINGDGHPDILTANASSNGVGILLGDGRGNFVLREPIDTDDRPSDLALGDLDSDGHLDITTANKDADTVSVLLRRKVVEESTRLVRASLPPCPAQALDLQPDSSFLAQSQDPCRIDRLEIEVALPPDATGSLSLVSPSQHRVSLVTLPHPQATLGLLTPEIFTALSRFEGHPFGGRWPLSTEGFELPQGVTRLLVNTHPDDPLSEATLASACSSAQDQPEDLDNVCRLDGTSLEGASLEDDDDEDIFLLEGDFDRIFIQGQVLTVTVTTEPDSILEVGLHAFRARKPLVTAEEAEAGVWLLSYTVPAEYSGRYLAVHIRGQGVEDLVYDLSAIAVIP